MNEISFSEWLLSGGMKSTVVQSRVGNCRTVERAQKVDLDVCYEKDRCAELIRLLSYSAEDFRANRPVRHNIPMKGNPYDGTSTYRSAIKKYVAFRESGGEPLNAVPLLPKAQKNAENGRENGMEYEEFMSLFKDWLSEVAEISENSAASYKSHINKLRVSVNKTFGEGWFDALLVDSRLKVSEENLRRCSEFIEIGVRSSHGKARKVWGDCRSAFHQLEEFIFDITDYWQEDGGAPAKNRGGAGKVARMPAKDRGVPPAAGKGVPIAKEAEESYSHSELVSRFLSRLKTQDRWYPRLKLLFPAQLVTKIFHMVKQNAWIEWLKDDIEHMHILNPDGNTVEFSEVERITIAVDGTVVVTRWDGSHFDMWTRTAAGKKVKQEANGIFDISIDHVKSLENVLREKKDLLKGLEKLMEMVTDYKVEIPTDRKLLKQFERDFFNQHRHELSNDHIRQLIQEDLGNLDLRYELMDRRENARKGKN